VVVSAGAQRGVAHVDLYVNGFKWGEAPGAAFGARGQPSPSTYSILVPSTLPNSIVDVKAIAYDDLGASTESAVITVTKGAPCATAATCAKGQKCESGKCFWDPPSGEIGASCSYAQFCKSGICTGTADQQICTQNCIPGVADSCPMGFDCLMSGPGTGVCFFSSSSSGGCCSVDRSGGVWWPPVGLGLAVLGLVARRRRRRR
jgi:MYXO-CTERM domain-containing protein